MAGELKPLFTWRSALVESDLPPVTRHVALTLSLHMNERGGSCWPSIDTITAETGLSRSTVCVHLAELKKQGWLETEGKGGRGKSNKYSAAIPVNSPGDGLIVDVNHPAHVSKQSGRRTGVLQELSNNGGTEVPPTRKPRKPDLIFNALCTFEGINLEKLNSAESGRIAKAKKLILESVRSAWECNGDDAEFKRLLVERAERVAEEIELRASRYAEKWPNADQTAMALANHWQQFGVPTKTGPRVTGWRWVRGTNSGTYVRDAKGTDKPPPGYGA